MGIKLPLQTHNLYIQLRKHGESALRKKATPALSPHWVSPIAQYLHMTLNLEHRLAP